MEFVHNQPEYSVSEIAGHVKRMVEDTFGFVRVRGEISQPNVNSSSGHCYLKLKDDKAVLEAVCWKGVMAKLAHKPQAGMEMIATGKLTTYPGSSKYQLVIESLEPAGVGALMAMLELRKKQLAAEGLFAPERKQPIPFLPTRIGIVTSPTGAVIRDILHRLQDRFPRHVLLWPVPVQGAAAANKIAEAIDGFNRIADPSMRPDLLIVARGGGSIEDLWAFNEEVVVRAVAASLIPIISAVGHETDTTLIDYAADKRAPTPTAAAEMAVPVRHELHHAITQHENTATQAIHKRLSRHGERIEGLARGLPRPQQLVAGMAQALDMMGERLQLALPRSLQTRFEKLSRMSTMLSPRFIYARIAQLEQQVQHAGVLLESRPQQILVTGGNALSLMSSRLELALPRHFQMRADALSRLAASFQPRFVNEQIARLEQRVQHASAMLESLNVLNVLKRGFALVKSPGSGIIRTASAMPNHPSFVLQFYDGDYAVTTADEPKKSTSRSKKLSQPGLFDT